MFKLFRTSNVIALSVVAMAIYTIQQCFYYAHQGGFLDRQLITTVLAVASSALTIVLMHFYGRERKGK
jgi:uncharacterized membrane protein